MGGGSIIIHQAEIIRDVLKNIRDQYNREPLLTMGQQQCDREPLIMGHHMDDLISLCDKPLTEWTKVDVVNGLSLFIDVVMSR